MAWEICNHCWNVLVTLLLIKFSADVCLGRQQMAHVLEPLIDSDGVLSFWLQPALAEGGRQ